MNAEERKICFDAHVILLWLKETHFNIMKPLSKHLWWEIMKRMECNKNLKTLNVQNISKNQMFDAYKVDMLFQVHLQFILLGALEQVKLLSDSIHSKPDWRVKHSTGTRNSKNCLSLVSNFPQKICYCCWQYLSLCYFIGSQKLIPAELKHYF